ncbi:hypothetical protein DBR43_18205 [Pedobacter sp. KBW06]|nr:hypothetical protein DBR43_18205 [Pedobacter sp. KBW06]
MQWYFFINLSYKPAIVCGENLIFIAHELIRQFVDFMEMISCEYWPNAQLSQQKNRKNKPTKMPSFHKSSRIISIL